MFMKNFLYTSICLTLVTIQKSQKFIDPNNKNVLGKIIDDSEGKIINEFVGLKSKMYSMRNIDGKESNTAKGVNIATKFNEFKDTLFNREIIRHKMRKIQGKKHNMKSTKYHYLFLMT